MTRINANCSTRRTRIKRIYTESCLLLTSYLSLLASVHRALPYAERHKAVGLAFSTFPFILSPFSPLLLYLSFLGVQKYINNMKYHNGSPWRAGKRMENLTWDSTYGQISDFPFPVYRIFHFGGHVVEKVFRNGVFPSVIIRHCFGAP